MLSGFTESLLIFIGLNIILGLSVYPTFSTGQISLGQAGFMAIGAYSSSILSTRLGVPFALALAAGGAAAALVGALIGIPAVRVRGIYLLIVTIAFNEIVRVFFLNFKPTGAATGLWGMRQSTNLAWVYGLVVLLILFFYNVQRSRLGRAFEAIRQNEVAVGMMGVNIARAKLMVFALGAAIAGLGGGLFAHYTLFIESELFGFPMSAEMIVYVVLGGMDTFWGPIVGAILLTILPEWLRLLHDWRMTFFGLLMIIFMIVRPRGLVGRETVSQLSAFVVQRLPWQRSPRSSTIS
ncbi:MAG: branched-chain amino acid ABC transporter permease [Candidatus Tectomicrobia bacterium]|nr:branched-chain amino acid ABC transporter permease [Candidatus Tectomicrobia bacterium]